MKGFKKRLMEDDFFQKKFHSPVRDLFKCCNSKKKYL